MTGDHYFSGVPSSEFTPRRVTVPIAGVDRELTTAGGVFSPDRIDVGTRILLANTPPPPGTGDLLDVGCGWGPIALTLATLSPEATVWAVDVNTRALELARMNADALGLGNVRTCLPDEVPGGVRFRAIWSNPPIRVGKNELHALLLRWLPRLEPGSDAHLVVQRNLGSDTLQKWLQAELPSDFDVSRAATGKGYRVIRARRHSGMTEPLGVVG